ncbi:hypothetical protein DFJ67_6973 [Asanoa ferruginea]|uniref:Uncharacterized protein n=1 Tax=Asanoa ferruginea TaxID=53367 RepID=A0A3D9ZWH4_9ACTN|nr:hypothetical protein [Asanoa ferruginea]REG00913.1 hypothetical protein DFJ67_6973 [Asanoa ferruginea]GIF47496.1 hypothetical protein Afe04nite_20350 [Asanoa ferruginea]
MLHPSLSIVCLPKATPTDHLADAADTRLTDIGYMGLGPAGHFITRGRARRRRGRLLQPWRNTAAGGPVALLDLDAMRTAGQHLYGYRWALWNQVVAGTRPAQPFWVFLDRHDHDPIKYPLSRAQRDYLSQPRIASMRTYNALPHKVMELPTAHLEAFQTGGQVYAYYGWLTAVPGDGLLRPDGRYLSQVKGDHPSRLTYLDKANWAIAALGDDDILVAVNTR